MVAAALPGIDELGLVVYIIKYLGVKVEVVDHHVGLAEALEALDRKEAHISGPGAHQIDYSLIAAGVFHGHLLKNFGPG